MRNGLLFLFGCLLWTTTAQAQPATLQGRVLDARTGEPLPGANVVIPSLMRGAATDVEGRYRIEDLPAGTYEVVARFIGYREGRLVVTLQPGATVTQDITLEEDLLQLDEVVVTGQGTSVARRKLATDVAVLTTRDIEEAPVLSVDQLLQGRVAGATIRLQSAQPGQAALIDFRGITSVIGSQTPVIYIDGIRVDTELGTSFSLGGELTSALAELITSDIERIEITRGGAASTLYGSDAASGVIQIFTKRGQAGRSTVTIRTELGFDQPETRFLKDTGFSFPQTREDPNDPNYGKTSFIRDHFLKNGFYQNYYVGFSGGSPTFTYNVSGRLQHDTGVQPKNENTLYALRANLQARVRPELEVSFSGSYVRSQFQRLFNGQSIFDPLTTFEVGDALFFSGAETFEEALRIFLLPDVNEGVHRFTAGSTIRFTPSPLFSTRLTVGIDMRANEQRVFLPIEFEPVSGDRGELSRYNRDFSVVTLEYVGTINYPQLGPVSSTFTFGVQGFREDESIITATGTTFALPGTEDLDEAATVTAEETRTQIFNGGIFFQEQLSFFDRLFLEAGLRLDGNSAFGKDVGLQAYPKIGISYNIHDEPFWRGTLARYISVLKLRAAYGETGKFPSPFARDVTFQATPFRGESAPRFDNPGNPELKPERTATLEAGFDALLLQNRLSLNVTFYRARTSDALLYVPEQPVTGKGTQLRNVGVIENTGIELAAEVYVFNRRDLQWSIGLSYHGFRNRMVDMGGAPPFAIFEPWQRVEEGHPVGEWYVTVPIDTNGDGLPDDSEFQFIGKTPYPTKTGSISTTLSLFDNRLQFYALADWATGSLVADYGSAWASFNGIERTVFPTRYDLNGNEIGKFRYREAFIALLKNGDYLKIRELSLRYSIPRTLLQNLPVQRASVTFSVRNVYTFAKQDLVDPELAGWAAPGDLQLGGVQSITLSPPRQFRFAVQVTL
ncbi:SusC/RagA family TonB-linked outer membrane protein [Rhodothermus profundi]|nr:SusC/RagA family TonB-linked outer membrane protein [Rhodothermus profundi]